MDKERDNKIIQSDSQNSAIKKLDASVIFANDPYGLFVFKKTEKLVAGIYLLTNYLSDKEPLKWNLRESANALLFKSISLSDRVWGEENISQNLISSIGEIISMLDVAKISQMISETNYEIIRGEFDKMADFLATSSKNLSSAKIAFGHNFFDGNYNFVSNQNYQNRTSGSQKDGFSTGAVSYKGQKDIKDVGNLNKTSLINSSLLEKKLKDKSNRQDIILNMLKGGLQLTIKDFAKNIKDCSEKTIQRELILLVSRGVIKREGERRWSKYSLV